MVKALFDQVARQVEYRTDPGITIEIRELLRSREKVESFTIEATTSQEYRVSVKLKTFGLPHAEQEFHSLIDFIEYPAATFYTRTAGDGWIEYGVLSLNERERGFYAVITFS
jgi:hypothetical protein